MSGEPAPGPGRDLARWNRRVIAERTGWPEGAVEICEQIEEAHPDWDVVWHPENMIQGFEAPAGYYATVWNPPRDSGIAYGADAETLSGAIEALSSDCPVCGARLPVPPGSTCPSHKNGSGYCQVKWVQGAVPLSSTPSPSVRASDGRASGVSRDG